MLLGIWRNIHDLESSISLEELDAILKSSREKEYRQNKFAAALKGINLDEDTDNNPQNKVEELKRRVAAKVQGKNEEHEEIRELGFDVEEE